MKTVEDANQETVRAAESVVEVHAIVEPVASASSVPILDIITPQPVVEEQPPIYVAVRAFTCRIGSTIENVKEGRQFTDLRAIKEMILQGCPICTAEEAAGFISCPHCKATFRPSPAQIALATAPSATKPTRAA